jgi:aryl-alcohol dehydrogenase-like predicted oxidoreductase
LVRTIKAAIDAGINFIDTADVYSEGRSEEITGLALKNLGIAREDIVVATKGFGRIGSSPGLNRVGATRSHNARGLPCKPQDRSGCI